jgi:hypothetical protein
MNLGDLLRVWGFYAFIVVPYDGRPGFGKVFGVAVSVCCAGWMYFLAAHNAVKQESYALNSEGSIILADLFQSDEYLSSSCLPEIEGESLGRDQLCRVGMLVPGHLTSVRAGLTQYRSIFSLPSDSLFSGLGFWDFRQFKKSQYTRLC